MANICTDKTRIGVTNLCVHVRTVHIYLSTAVVYDLAHLADSHLEDTMRGWIGNHTTRQVVLVLLGFLAPVSEVSVTILIAFHHHRNHTCLCTRGRVSAVSRSRDKEDIAMILTLLMQILADSHQTCILACSTRSRLQVASGKARDSSQLLLQVFHNLHISSHLLSRCQWVNAHITGIGHRYHCSRRVELHGARTQWNHCMGQTNIFALQTFEITHHLGLGVI